MALVLLPSVYHLRDPKGIGFGPGYEMASIAKELAAHGTFGNPFYPYQTGPTAVVPPLYPAFLALAVRLFVTPAVVVWAVVLANILVNAVIAFLLPRLSEIFFSDSMPGVFAAVLWLSACRLMPNWDAGFTTLGLMLFYLVSTHGLLKGKGLLLSGALTGGVAGVLFLLNPASLLVFTPCSIFLLWVHGIRWTGCVRYVLSMGCTAVLLVIPWLTRNDSIWGTPAFRTNLGMTLYSSNNDCAQPSLVMEAESDCYQSYHPSMNIAEAALLRTVGEVEYDRMRMRAAFRWIRDHPKRFAWLTLGRTVEFWFPFPAEPRCFSYGVWLITALSIPGSILMARRKEKAVWLVLAVSLLYPLMYYVVVSDARYRYPIIWLSLLPAGYGLHALVAAFGGWRSPGLKTLQNSATPHII